MRLRRPPKGSPPPVNSEEIAQSVQSISMAARGSAQGVMDASSVASQLEMVADQLQGRVQQFEVGDEGSPPETGSPEADSPKAGYGGDGQPTASHPAR